VLACRIINVLVTVLSVVTIPLQLVTTTVGGCLVGCTFGLLLLPISLIWTILFWGPLLATSWLWERAEVLRMSPLVSVARIPIGVIGVPLAVLADTYVSLMPESEPEAKQMKLIICWVWPFSLDYFRFYAMHRPLDSPGANARYYRLQQAVSIARWVLPPLDVWLPDAPDERL